MYMDLEKGDNNQWKFYFSRTVFRFQKQYYEELFEEAQARFDRKGGVNDVDKATMDDEVVKLLATHLGPKTFKKLNQPLKQ